MSVVVRFAPSPTGYLHIGGARTALFNWLFARSKGGKFLLRIEDTDRARSTDDAIEKIFEGLRWLGLDWDGEPVFQFARAARHADIAQMLMSEGKAYHCWSTQEELEAMRAKARAEGRQPRYDGTWRDRDPALAPKDVKPVVRLRAPQTGETTVHDMVQGEVTVPNAQLDDMVLLRGDGTPTYMLSVVVDDADMGITHVIRGDDHLTNTFRQVQLYRAMGVEPPVFGHIPLIHGPDGAKLSKRHGALGIEAYRDMGMLPEAMRNYLMRLGWSHGDADVISTEQAVQWFDMSQVGRSPSRFDMQKLTSLNAHWLRERSEEDLIGMIEPLIQAEGFSLDATGHRRLAAGMAGLKARCRTLNELAEAAAFYVEPRPIRIANDAVKILDEAARQRLAAIAPKLADVEEWSEAALEAACRQHAEQVGVGFGKLAQPLRVALTGSTVSPGLFEVMAVLGKDEVVARLDDAAQGRNGEKKARQ
ncbi:MAG TPA: glutamate--tRNA ligase [Geminicoccus sp.]|jgi:glutamyl-tRNA synthetase|uniref:glutamate--tRNA ligase n=1 Tax=Geminicoccus sp. TaxID=2024832 RepID=UPI002E364E6A|nr:glutamate--tRNA ligase [Geminicoccus sp.]HEX2527744.1 glutamate--tRNA ligase [Geminicoccus sp.]